MPYPPPLEARVVLIDGPLSLFLHPAPEQEILDALVRLTRLARVAATQLDTATIVSWEEPAYTGSPGRPMSSTLDDRGGGTGGEGGP